MLDRKGDGDDADDAIGVTRAASLPQEVATEPKPVNTVKRTRVLGGEERALGPDCASYEGTTCTRGCTLRYVLRPSLSLPRLERFRRSRATAHSEAAAP